MSVEQFCLLIVLNLLVGTFIARLERSRATGSVGMTLVAMILTGFAIIWRSLTP